MLEDIKASLLNKAKYLTTNQTEELEQAISFAEQAHEGQKRATGEPYIIHPFAVCDILLEYKADVTTLMAGLLHDVVEDTSVTKLEIEQKFGSEVAIIVAGLTKVKKEKLGKDERSAINFEKLLSASEKDIRVAIVKLADRLHNMRTLAVKRVEKRVPYANETLIFFAPLAERLGLRKIQEEIENLGFSYLNPQQCKRVSTLLNNYQLLFENVFHECKNRLQLEMDWTETPIYKAYSLLQEGHALSELFTIHVMTNHTIDCYSIIGTIHQNYTPIEHQFHDYIAIKKYPFSKHLVTKVLVNETEVLFHIQTRTNRTERDEGIFSLLKVNQSKDDRLIVSKQVLGESVSTVKSISDNSMEFYDLISYELFQKELTVYTPKMDVVHLPEGATVIDFAIQLDHRLAKNLSNVKINGEKRSIFTELKDMDIIELSTSEKSTVQEEWINHVQTAKAIKVINEWLEQN